MAYFIGRRYGDFNRLHKKLRTELPGKILPPLPKKNRQHSTASNLMSGVMGGDDDASSLSSVSTMGALGVEPALKSLTVQGKRVILGVEFMLIVSRSPKIRIGVFQRPVTEIFSRCVKGPRG